MMSATRSSVDCVDLGTNLLAVRICRPVAQKKPLNRVERGFFL